MIIIELIYNLFALLSLSVISNFIVQKHGYKSKKSQLYHGLLFGLISIIGMSNPLVLEKGIIFDGRSIVISLCSLLFGPVSGIISAGMATIFRIYLGGAGTLAGIMVITTSFLSGYYFYSRYNKRKTEISNLKLYFFGIFVNSLMIGLMLLLPFESFIKFLKTVAPTVFIFYPLITVGIGRILLNQIISYDNLIFIKDNEESLKTTLYSIGDAVISTDVNGKIIRMNLIAEQLTGWKEDEAKGKGIEEVFVIRNETTNLPTENPAIKAINEGIVTKLTNHTILISKNGKVIPIVDSASPIKRENQIIGAVLVFRDQTEERKKLKQLEEKEKFQRFLISNLPGFIYRCANNKNWTMFYISDGCFEVTGYKPEEFLEDKPAFNDIIHPDYQDLLHSIWEEILRKKEIFEYEYQIYTKSGELRWVWERGRGIFSDSGELLYLEGFITDISTIKNYRIKLEENEKKLGIITTLISDYLFSTRIDEFGKSQTDWVAGAFEEITGYTFDEYIANGGWHATIHPEDLERDNNDLQQLLNNQNVVSELRVFHKSGKIVWVKIYAHPIWNENEKRVTGIIGAVQNITSIKINELLSQIEIKISDAILSNKSELEIFEIIRQHLAQFIDVKNFFAAFYDKETRLLKSIVETDEKDNIPIWKAKGSLSGFLMEQNKTLNLTKSDLQVLIEQGKFKLIGTIPEQWLGVPLKIGNEVVGVVVIQDYNNANAFDEIIVKTIENIANILSVYIDRKRREEQIKESEERLRNLFENQEAILLLMDAESGMIIDANKSAQDFYKMTLDELKEKTVFDLDLASTEEIKKSMIKIYKKTQSRFEAKHKLADGQIRDVELYTTLITIKNHKFFYSIIFDITEKKKVEMELQLLKTAIIQNPAIITITNTNGEIEFVNPKFIEVCQYTFEEVKGKKPNILKSSFHPEEFYEEMWRKIKNGEDWHGEILNKRKDGTLFWVETIISPIMDSRGNITHFVSVQEDITQRKKMLESIIKSEVEFRSVWENSVDAMRLVNENGIVVNVNQAYCNLFKMKRNQLIGKPFNVAYVVRDSDRTLNAFIQRFRLRTIRNKFEIDILLHDGNLIWVELTSTFIEIKNSPTLLLSIFRDITSYKKLIQETIQAKEKAEEMNKVKSYFFANMSHELRTPLVGILGFADILREELEDNPELAKMAELISKSGRRLHETLNLILSLSKLEAGKIEVKISEENIIPHIKNSFILFEQAAKSKNLDYKLEISEQEIFCRIDPNLIQNIFNNLINNAIKFTDKGGVTVKVDIVRNRARIQIIDTGIGIPKENQPIIWEEFRQVSEGLNRSFEGTGLGLTIVKRFTTLMGGKVSLISEKDKGSNFILEFPLVDKKTDTQLKNITKLDKIQREGDLSKNKFQILYVEDDQSSVDFISLILKNKYSFDIARTPDEALIKVKQNLYQAILMDINLKQMIDGIQLTSLIRKIEGYSEIPIAAITAYALEKDKDTFLSHGMTHYLAKPFSKADLYNLLDNMLKK